MSTVSSLSVRRQSRLPVHSVRDSSSLEEERPLCFLFSGTFRAVAANVVVLLAAAAVFRACETENELSSRLQRARLVTDLEASLPEPLFERFRREFGVGDEYQTDLAAEAEGRLESIERNWGIRGMCHERN